MITIAFAGNRIHPHLSAIQPVITAFLNALQKVLLQEQGSGHITMLNGFADGADMEAGEAFHTWYSESGIHKTSVAVLPFAIDDYEQAIDDKVRYRYLLGECDKVVALDNVYAVASQQHTEDNAVNMRNKAYQRQALYMLERCDMLLAAADPTATVKPGGTLDTVGIAQHLGIPVVLMPLHTNAAPIKAALLPANERQPHVYNLLRKVAEAMISSV